MNNEILELNEKDKIKGEIYKITCIITKKCYIGQTLTHRRNKGKYRPFGSLGRFKGHISEALNNTKKKQCTYLNNAIRKYGEKNFIFKVIEYCNTTKLDELEKKYIKECNTLYPNGYNLTKGGKGCKYIKVNNNSSLNIPTKRGREYGYKHKDTTKKLMSKRLKKICNSKTVKNRMSNVMRNYYDNKKIITISKYNLDKDIEKYIHPVRIKNTNKIHTYVIKINNKKYKFDSKLKNEKLQDIYNRAKMILEKSLEYKSKNSKISERKIDDQQSDT